MRLSKQGEETLVVPTPFDFKLTVRKPAGWDWAAPDEVFNDESGTFWSAIRLSAGCPVGLRLMAHHDSSVTVTLFGKSLTGVEKQEAIDRVKLGLGFADDLGEFYALGAHDELVAQLAHDLYGMRIGHQQSVFEMALLTITLQMAPLRRSEQMLSCLINNYGDRIEFDGKSMLVWPTPGRIAPLDPAELSRECVLGYRGKFVVRVAQAIVQGFPDILQLAAMPADEAFKTLQTLPGIGEYSAAIMSPHYGFALDVWTARIFHEILFGFTPDKPRDMIRRVQAAAEERWGRFKGYVLYYTLHDLTNLQQKYGISRLA